MGRRRQHEDHTNHEAWAIPYGDLVTLLLAFFVVMYAMSTVNQGKYRVLAETLNAEFRGKPTTIAPVQLGDRPLGPSTATDVPAVSQPLVHIDPVALGTEQSQAEHKDSTDAQEHNGTLDQLADNMEAAMSNLIHDKLVAVRRHDLWVEVEIQTDILFSSGSSTLSPLAIGVLEPLADSLRSFKNAIRVEGHTDNVAIKTVAFPSNWELSAARAATVVHLFSARGIDPSRLTVIGYGEFRPIASNTTLEGRNANRRVLLVIMNIDQGVNQSASTPNNAHTGVSVAPNQ
jgi:chemotaxis protein MotB